MALIQRQWRTWLAVVAVLAGVFLLWDKHPGYAAGDVTVNSPTDFATLDASDGTVDGVFNLLGNLLIDTGGSINCNDPSDFANSGDPACAINIVGGGNLTMNAGSGIFAENRTDGGAGANIAITVSGDFTMHGPSGANAGAIISSRKLCLTGPCGTANGGNITIIVGGVTVNNGVGQCNTPSGDALIEEGATITSDSVIGDAGDIRIYSGRNLTVDGTVRAQGGSTTGQGGLIWLDACCGLLIDVHGQVLSVGLDPGADLVHIEGCVVQIRGLVASQGVGHETSAVNSCNDPIRPGKPANSTECVEIWSGTTITIDGTAPENGQVLADAAQVPGRSWIDILANLDISIFGNATLPYPTDNDVTSPNWAVHANESDQNGTGGVVTVMSRTGAVSTTGRAIQANASTGSNGGKGGEVLIAAGGAGAPLGNVNLDGASIQAIGDTTGGSPAGGSISVNSNGEVTGAAPGSLDAHGDAAGSPGSVSLKGCVVSYTGASDPAAVPDNTCAGVPILPAPAATLLPSSDCVQFCSPATPTPTPTLTPTPITPTPGTTTFNCVKAPVRTQLNGKIPDVTVFTDGGGLIQPAVNSVTDSNNDGYIIVGVQKDATGNLGGHTTQTVVIDRVFDKPFWLIGCSVTLHDPTPNDGNPVIQITSAAFSPGPQNIFAMDLHTADSGSVGFESTGNNRYIRNTNSLNNAIDFKVTGNGNTMHNGSATYAGKRSNGTLYPAGPNVGVGFWLTGDNNLITDTTIQYNRSHGILAAGNGNQVLKTALGDVSGRGNLGDGLNLSGNNNAIQENTVRANTLDGIHIVSGTGNTMKKNVSGGTASQNNLDCEFNVVAGNVNNGENKSNGVTVPGAVASPFPTGCTGSP